MRTQLRILSFVAITAVGIVVVAPASLTAQDGAPDPDGFEFYWSGSCAQAIQRSSGFYWRSRQDSLRYDPMHDTMLTISADLARECIAKIKTTDLTSRDYIPLISAYLAAGDDDSAAITASRRLALPDIKTSAQRAWVLADIVQVHLAATPARIKSAQFYLKILDVLSGAPAAVGKVRAYRSLAAYYWRRDDIPNMITASERLIVVGRELSEHDRKEFGMHLFIGYRYLAEAEALRSGNSVAPHAVMTKASAEIGTLMNVGSTIRNFTSIFGLYGAKAPRIVADEWIGPAGDTIYPVSGKFTLIVFRPHRGNIPAIRRLAEKYQDRVKVVGVLSTSGYFQDLGPLTPQLEAQELKKYYVDQMRLPWVFALSYTEFTNMPDGRRSSEPPPNDQAYKASAGATVVLVDPQGMIRQVWTSWDKSYEVRIEAAILRESAK